jgi:hypothetical protein
LPNFIDHRVSDWSTWVTARDGSLCRRVGQRGAVTGFGIRQNPAIYASKTVSSEPKVSPRAASMRNACVAFPRVLAAGLVLPPNASPIVFRRSGLKRPQISRCTPPYQREKRTFSLASCHRRALRQVEKRGQWLEVEDPIAKGECANTHLQRSNPKRVRKPEASGDALPLPPIRDQFEPRTTLSVGSGHAFFRARRGRG